MADDWEFRIAKLFLQPGDVLVVKTDDPRPKYDVFRELVPGGVRVLYIPTSIDLSVLTRTEIEELLNAP
jgi:hypothetical protein